MVDVESPSLRLSLRLFARPRSAPLIIPCGRRRLRYEGRPLVMGILNVTPDSFSDGGHFSDPAEAIARGMQMADEGADLIDVGGESTRPGASAVPAEEEARRVVPVIRQLAARIPVPVSVDTSKPLVAARALDAGAGLINDVTALRDPDMARVASAKRAAVILMHMPGTPRTMQRRPRYRNVVDDVARFLRDAAARAEAAGIAHSRILLDPGLGFGKTVRHNLALLGCLETLVALGWPVAIGPSRKSFIGVTLTRPVAERLPGTLACVARAYAAGAHMVRVHDVKAARDVIRMLDAMAHA